jgi:hypothetical protein
MEQHLINEISSFTLATREKLETETSTQLEGIYGWLPDGTFAKKVDYPALNEMSEAEQTRTILEQYTDEEKIAGNTPLQARRKLVREAAFTWLNRLVALRMLEERRLIKQTISKLHQSNAFLYWLTENSHSETYAFFKLGTLPLNRMGEGPADVAYRKFLLWQCE